MEATQKYIAAASMGASWLVLIAAIVWMGVRGAKRRRTPEKHSKTGLSAVLVFSGFLIAIIWLLRFAVGYYSIVVSQCPAQELTPWEEIANSLFKALRTFSMEEEYDAYILGIKGLIAELIPSEHWSFPLVQNVMVVYASILNLLAPIMGGAIVLEILASAFPKIKLRWSYLHFRRPKYYFSELNPASLALAKSLFYAEEKTKPILIFTDTYVDDEKEKESELLQEAKKFDAICVRDDLIHVAKVKRGKRAFYLMDENEFGNLQTLMGLVEDENVKFLRNAEIYLFVQSEAYVQIERQIYKKLDEEKKRKLLKGGEKPTIVPINGHRNLVNNLFVDVPLFEPLIRKGDPSKFDLTILGNGIIGTEAFLSAYWFGQMLISRNVGGKSCVDECEMTINIVSNDKEDVFWSKIDYINSEIRDTVRVLKEDKCEEKPDLLVYDDGKHTNKPYCSVRYVKADVKVDGFWDGNIPQAQKLLESDYFIVALGNDADNISIADKLRRLIGKKHLEEDAEKSQEENGNNVVIAYAVFDSALARILNEKNAYQCREKGKTDIYLYAFGSIEQVYSYNNVTMSKSILLAEGTGEAYNRAQRQQSHIDDNKDRKNDESRNYSYWANLARAMHIRYKAFSLGLIQESIFDHAGTSVKHEEYIAKQCDLYKRIVTTKGEPDNDIAPAHKDAQIKMHLLAWLEHRRWTAFTRTMGYQRTREYHKNLHLNGENHKNMELKLHPCLVEAKKPVLDGANTYQQKTSDGIFIERAVTVNAEMLDKYQLTAVAVKDTLGEDKTISFALHAEGCDLYKWLIAALGDDSRLAKRLEELLTEKKAGFVLLNAMQPESGEIWPVAIKVENDDKVKISAVFKVNDLSVAQMIALLRISRAYFEAKGKAAARVSKTGFDLLDILTVDWCVEAARFSVHRIDELLEKLQKQENLEKIKETYAAVWCGINCHDFKKHDYCFYDFD